MEHIWIPVLILVLLVGGFVAWQNRDAIKAKVAALGVGGGGKPNNNSNVKPS